MAEVLSSGEKVGRSAHERIKAHFNLEIQNTKLGEIYQRVMTDVNPGAAAWLARPDVAILVRRGYRLGCAETPFIDSRGSFGAPHRGAPAPLGCHVPLRPHQEGHPPL